MSLNKKCDGRQQYQWGDKASTHFSDEDWNQVSVLWTLVDVVHNNLYLSARYFGSRVLANHLDSPYEVKIQFARLPINLLLRVIIYLNGYNYMKNQNLTVIRDDSVLLWGDAEIMGQDSEKIELCGADWDTLSWPSDWGALRSRICRFWPLAS